MVIGIRYIAHRSNVPQTKYLFALEHFLAALYRRYYLGICESVKLYKAITKFLNWQYYRANQAFWKSHTIM